MDDCSPPIDPVSRGPKCFNNGTCVDQVGGYSCTCLPGFVGERCEGDVNECLSNPCDARGTQNCVQRVNDFHCECRAGHTGGCGGCRGAAGSDGGQGRARAAGGSFTPLPLAPRAPLRIGRQRLQGEAVQERRHLRRGLQHGPRLHLQVPGGRFSRWGAVGRRRPHPRALCGPPRAPGSAGGRQQQATRPSGLALCMCRPEGSAVLTFLEIVSVVAKLYR